MKKDRLSLFVLWFAKVTNALHSYLFFKPRVRYESIEQLPKKKGAIIISNHYKLIDYVLLLLIFPFRTLRFMIAEVLYSKNKFLSWLLDKLGSIRIDRESAADAGYINAVEKALEKGHIVGIFPEGRLNKDPKAGFLPFKTGAAYLAMKNSCPIIPVYHDTRYGIFKRAGVMIGDSINLNELFPGEPTRERILEATKYLEEKMESLRKLHDKKEEEREEKKYSSAMFRLSSKFIFHTSKWGMNIMYRPKYHYVDEKVQGRKLPEHAIVVSNHTNFMDPVLICTVFCRDKLHMIAGEILYDIPILHWLLPHYGCIKIDRTAIDMDSFRKMNATLKKGECIGLFPEGNLNKTDELLPFKAGMVLSAVMTKSPIIPIYISGKYKVFGKRMDVVIDKPFVFDTSAPPTGEYLDKIAADIRTRMIELKEFINKEN